MQEKIKKNILQIHTKENEVIKINKLIIIKLKQLIKNINKILKKSKSLPKNKKQNK